MDKAGLTALSLQVVVLGLCLTSAGCMTGLQTTGPLYQDESLAVRIESNPAGTGQMIDGKGTQTITAQQLSGILRGLYGRRNSGSAQPEPVFQEEELKLVAGELSKGLRVASPQERVTFQLRRARERGREETSGAIYLRGNLLYVNLVQFRSSGSVRFDDAEYIEKPNFELLFEPAEAVVPKEQGFVSRWVGARSPEVIVDILKVSEGYASAGARPALVPRRESSEPVRPPQPPPVVAPSKTESAIAPQASQSSSAASVDALQRQVKELNEELVRLRQELEETKQLLADKVLELNRVQNKANGAGAGRK
jgi:hypothetical protein